MSDEKKAYFSPLPKMSMGNKKRKSINYLQQCKEEGKKIVQHCPSMLSPLFSMAASMADVDIARLPPAAITGHHSRRCVLYGRRPGKLARNRTLET